MKIKLSSQLKRDTNSILREGETTNYNSQTTVNLKMVTVRKIIWKGNS